MAIEICPDLCYAASRIGVSPAMEVVFSPGLTLKYENNTLG